uniref:DUF4806 domain-containing protein n=1 Tax=Anopheles farauti TaxID=69004 RepID=A0A182PZW8_9DIPT
MGESTYLCWPNHRNLKTINALLNDEHSIPSDDWEKHKCNIICKHIPSLKAAEKIVEMMQGDRKVSDKETPATYDPNREHDISELLDEPAHEFLSDLDTDDGVNRVSIMKALQQLIRLIMEMKNLMESNQEEMRSKLNAGFHEIRTSVLASIRQEMSTESNEDEEILIPNSVEQTVPDGTVSPSEYHKQFTVELLTCKEQLEDFEQRLADEKYRNEVHEWIDDNVADDASPEFRMHELLDLLFDKKFFATFSWLGGGKDKRPMCCNKNTIKLFEYTATTGTHRPTKTMSYVMVETTDATGTAELVAAPVSWIQWEAGGLTYLCWPNQRNVKTLQNLLNDECSVPRNDWEKHKCSIICKNIPTLEAAETIVEAMQEHSRAVPIAPSVNDDIVEEQFSEQQSLPDSERMDTEDPLVEEKPIHQLINLVVELKSLIENGQQETWKRLNESIYQMQKGVLSVIEKRLSAHFSKPPADDQMHVKLMTCMEEFQEFENRLKDGEFKKQVREWVDYNVGHEKNPDFRMHLLLDLLFDKHFFATFSWAGHGKDKHPMYTNKNTLKLFEYAGTTNELRVNQSHVELFFKKKLSNATKRLFNLGVRKSVPHRNHGKKRTRKLASEEGTNQSESEDQMIVNAKSLKTESSSSKVVREMSSVKEESSPEFLLSTDSVENVIVEIDPVTSIQALDDFEKQLNEDDFRENIHIWIDNTVGDVSDKNHRMTEILNRMLYVMVETTGETGAAELLAAPVSWIHWETDGTTYLCWPNQRNVKTLHALLTDERTVPEVDWEKHKCNIICKNIPSLVAAEKIVETMQDERNARTYSSTDNPLSVSDVKEEHSSDVSFDQDEDPLAEGKPIQQLIHLIVELKSLIETYQQEIRMRLNEGFHKMQRTVFSTYRKQTASEPGVHDAAMPEATAQTTLPCEDGYRFNVKLLTSAEELEDFENRLNDDEYKREVHEWIDYSVGHETNPDIRTHQLLDLLFDKKFFATFSWRGGGKDKRPLCTNKNTLKLFEYAGSIDNQSESEGQQLTENTKSPEAGPSSSVKSSMMRTSSSEPLLNAISSDSTVVQVNPIINMQAMVIFEQRLSVDAFRENIHDWIDNTVGHLKDTNHRMSEVLDRLVDKNFLRNFCWTAKGNGKQTLMAYKNVVQLFEYASRTILNQTIIFNHVDVANFFIRKLDQP